MGGEKDIVAIDIARRKLQYHETGKLLTVVLQAWVYKVEITT